GERGIPRADVRQASVALVAVRIAGAVVLSPGRRLPWRRRHLANAQDEHEHRTSLYEHAAGRRAARARPGIAQVSDGEDRMSFGETYPAPRYPAPVVAQSLPRLDTSDLYELERRLIGVSAPTVPLPFAPDAPVSLAELARRRSLVVFFFPGATASTRWGEDPGTAQAWAWRERETELELLGCIVVGVSTPSPEAQAKFAADELLGYMLLSDTELELARELALPTMNVAGKR